MKLLRTVIILVVGLVAGVFLARFLPGDTTPQTVQSEQPRSVPAAVSTTRLATPILTLRGTGAGNLQSAALATAVGEPTIVLAAIDDFAGAPSLVVETANGQVVPIVAVAASDERYGIAALRTASPLNGVEVMQPEPGTGSLYLGRSVVMQSRDFSYDAQVDSSAIQEQLGDYRYRLKTQTETRGEAAALIDRQSRGLLGFAVASGVSAVYVEAIDNDPVNRLLAEIGVQPQRSLDEYSSYYFSQTTVGRLALLRQLVASEQLSSAIRFGDSIMNLDVYTQQNSRPLLHTAYAGMARLAIENLQWRRAIQLLNKAEQSVGLNEELRLMRVEAYQAVGQLELALDDLLAMRNPSAHRVRMMVIENALAAGQDERSGLSLLERALATDPDFAPYHRMLGEALARQGDFAGALAALETALALDPSMAMELDPLLQRLRSRRDTPALTEVPIQREGGTLFVTARVNGSNQTFRFLFDTGASYTAITSETALRLGINNIFFGAPVVGLETANGRVYTTTATLSSIDVGGARVNQVEAVILESMRGVDGLLGQSFLRHFDIDINRTRGVIVFNRRLDE